MREDESNIRRFMPLMRRGIILAAVVTAVPVVMWTVTSLVRNYLAPPQPPAIETMTASPIAATPDQAIAASTDMPPTATPIDTKTAQLPSAPTANPTGNTPTGNGSGAGPAITITSSVAPGGNAPPPAPKPAAGTPPKMAMANPVTNPPANPTPNAAPLAPARTPNDIWPAAPTASSAPEPLVPPSADALAQSEPIAGPVPLPRRRPSSFVIAQGGIPLPRPRPIDAVAPAADETQSAPLDWLYTLFRPSSPAPAATAPAAIAPQQDRLNAH